MRLWWKFGVAGVLLVAVNLYCAINYVDQHYKRNANSRPVVSGGRKGISVVNNMDKTKIQHSDNDESSDVGTSEHWRNGIHISVVACGDRLEESLVMLKSVVLFAKSLLVFHIFAEDALQQSFKEQTLLSDVDTILYVDTDVLFLSPVEMIWSFFSKFNSTQLAAVSTEHDDARTGWYNRFAKHPFYGKMGINSGVILMNLTRLRQSMWMTALENYYREFKSKIFFGDQDLINIYFYFYPLLVGTYKTKLKELRKSICLLQNHTDQVFIFSCVYNYRSDHCMFTSVCEPVEDSGAYMVHGNRRVWHEDKQPAFKAIYTAFKKHKLGASIEYGLLESVHEHLNDAKPSNCGNRKHVFVKQIQNYVNSLKSSPR